MDDCSDEDMATLAKAPRPRPKLPVGQALPPGREDWNERNEKSSSHLRMVWRGETSEMSVRSTRAGGPALACPAYRRAARSSAH